MTLQQEIAALESVEHLTETNEGTFGATEARRKVGCGDPQFATRRVFETIGGRRRETGPDEDCAPGFMRQLNRDAVATGRKRLAELRRSLDGKGAR